MKYEEKVKHSEGASQFLKELILKYGERGPYSLVWNEYTGKAFKNGGASTTDVVMPVSLSICLN